MCTKVRKKEQKRGILPLNTKTKSLKKASNSRNTNKK